MKKSNQLNVICRLAVLALACPPVSGRMQTCTLNWTDRHQTIDGFGASSAWTGWNLSDAQADLFFSTKQGISYTSLDGTASYTFNGAGLSLLRNHIYPSTDAGGNPVMVTFETVTMQKAQALGARIWSTPWTPAAEFKNLNDIYDTDTAANSGLWGGSYAGNGNDAVNTEYALELAGYVASMKNDYNVTIYAVSIQNEPDAKVTSYEACQWSSQQIHDFIPNLSSALASAGTGSTKIIIPESQNWPDPKNLAGIAMSDPATAAQVGIIANHNYVPNNNAGDQTTPASFNHHGKQVWETEVSTFSTFDGSINNAIYWATRIHLFLTAPGVEANAWHYWWLWPYTNDNSALVDTNGIPARRLFALGNFSRFVRPGYVRFGVTGDTGGALISAYQGPDGNFAVVAVNTSAAPINQTFNLSNFPGAVSSVTPWITSSSLSLASQPAGTVAGNSFAYLLPAMSVVTFVGNAMIPVNPVIQVTPMSTAFGTILRGTSVTNNFTVSNTGNGILNGTASVGAPFRIVSGGSYSLGVNQNQIVRVSFNPPSAGDFSQSVTLTGGGGASVGVSGSATNAPLTPPSRLKVIP